MLTLEQAKEYLAQAGITLPDFVLQALLDQQTEINECLEANYPSSTILLIQLALMGLLTLGMGYRYLSSQTAPSGASRSFTYKTFADTWRSNRDLLRLWDTEGCADSLIPEDPTITAHAGLWVAKGGCMCGG